MECDVYYSYHMYLTLDKTSVTKYEYIYVSVFHLSKQEYLIKSLAIISKQASKCPKLTLASARALSRDYYSFPEWPLLSYESLLFGLTSFESLASWLPRYTMRMHDPTFAFRFS